MGKIKLKNKKSVNRVCLKRKGMLCLIGFVIFFSFLFIIDGIQQKRFQTLRNGYRLMDNQKYTEAIDEFDEYLSVDCKLYWKLTEIMNGHDFSKEGVESAIEECKESLVKIDDNK